MKKLLLVIATLALSGCATAQMELPQNLAGVSPMEVSGANPRRWSAPLSFGDWATGRTGEAWRRGWGLSLLGIDVSYAVQPYAFAVGNGSELVAVECITRDLVVGRKSLSVDPSFGRIPALACAMRGPSADDATLRLYPKATAGEEGRLTLGGDEWNVRSIQRIEGGRVPSSEPVGYELASSGRTVAAVETINRGRVWIDPSLDPGEKARVAAAATALLLYRANVVEE